MLQHEIYLGHKKFIFHKLMANFFNDLTLYKGAVAYGNYFFPKKFEFV